MPVLDAVQPSPEEPPRRSKLKELMFKMVWLTAFTLLLGLAQGWAASRTYQPDYEAGFHIGLLHGMLMPAALPGLLLGQNLKIYAPNNSGRAYNIGYIFGINTCGTIFFGIAFWQRKGQTRKELALPPKSSG